MKLVANCVAGIMLCVLPTSLVAEVPTALPTTTPSTEYHDRKQLFGKIEQKLKAEAEYDEVLRDTSKTFQASLDGQLLLAYLAMVDGRDSTAIDILNGVVNSGSEKAIPGLSVPAPIGARFWKSTVYRHSGQVQAALREMVELRRLPLGKGQEVNTAMLLLYEAELMENVADNTKAMAALAEVEKLPKPVANDMGMLLAIYKAWARYELQRMRQGTDVAQKELTAGKYGSPLTVMAVSHHLMVNGILAEPAVGLLEIPGFSNHVLQRTAGSVSSRLDRQFCLLLYGRGLLQRGQSIEAEEVLTRLANSDSFLAPDAILILVQGADKQADYAKASSLNAEAARRFPKYTKPPAQ